MEFVERFNDWSVRQWDGAEFYKDGKYYHGMIKKLSEEGIEFKPFEIDFDRPENDESFPSMWIPMADFDKIKLEIWDEHRGGDNSSIGVSGCFEEWRWVWPDENISIEEMKLEYIKSLEPKQLELELISA